MHRTGTTGEDDAAEANRQTVSLGGLAVALALLVLALFLFHHLREKSRMEDCLMAGRQDCAALQP